MTQKRELYVGNERLVENLKTVTGEIVDIAGENYYKISNYDQMEPFFMTIVSDSDHWMFISSNGGLTCGRKNPENALFPYYTDDKIHDSAKNTGPATILIVTTREKPSLWEPFSENYKGCYEIERNLYKSVFGNKLVFEEINKSLEILFSYSWKNSDKYGFIRESIIKNLNDKSVTIDLVDGIRNILPYGVNRMLQTNMSTLVDGYKKCELIEGVNLGIYTLSSILTDRAEPSEALKATTVWSKGLPDTKVLLSTNQLDSFRKGNSIETEKKLKGRRGAFFVHSQFQLNANEQTRWLIVANLCQGPSDVPALINKLRSTDITCEIEENILTGTENLKSLVASSDGFQLTNEQMSSARHFSNILFNCMRGGIFSEGYIVPKEDFLQFVKKWNKKIFNGHKLFLDKLNEKEQYPELLKKAANLNDSNLERLVLEYLPLTFSRRHGDPSRPWNLFSIDIKNPDGSKNLNYQGNWRDIFQNWEALSLAFPEYIESFIAKFVNASTADGYNPYRVTKNGIDWEVLDPEDPWSNIGYWGDHQIIYLLKLLELSGKYHPGLLVKYLSKEIFVYANVPYRIKDLASLISNPHASIEYAQEVESEVTERVTAIGSDGKLVFGKDDEPYKANLIEKILISVLAKFCNFVPGGGIWMNTQRPEWNDANNALVGHGLSMVTLYYLRRFQSFMLTLLESAETTNYAISEEIAAMFFQIDELFESYRDLLKGEISDKQRKTILDRLGTIGSDYRKTIYTKGFSGKKESISSQKISEFIQLSLDYLDHSITANKRSDGLYHAYNLVRFNDGGYAVEHLHEMLEGQVAVLSSGYLSIDSALDVLEKLRKSSMYRADQKSYMLYPDRELPDFLKKNIISDKLLMKSDFLNRELEKSRTQFIEKDILGEVHFNGLFRNSKELRKELKKVDNIADNEIETICSIFEDTFNHKQFTGRSGTFFKYEGLGCIYWHMVSKLMLVVQELYFKALTGKSENAVLSKLKEHYYSIKGGLGIHKSPIEYGAFPIDPYSHTPGFAGVQQPGLTGQVKEDIITRFGELGVQVKDGQICFSAELISKGEFLTQNQIWDICVDSESVKIDIEKGSIAFTICRIPVIYKLENKNEIVVEMKNKASEVYKGNSLSKEISRKIFERKGEISKIMVGIDARALMTEH